MSEVIKKRLEEARRSLGLGPKEFGAKIGVSEQTIRGWERTKPLADGRDPPFPNAEMLVRYVKACGWSPSYLLGLVDTVSGIQPNSWVLDEDKYEQVKDAKDIEDVDSLGLVKPLPRRPRLLDSAQMRELMDALRSK